MKTQKTPLGTFGHGAILMLIALLTPFMMYSQSFDQTDDHGFLILETAPTLVKVSSEELVKLPEIKWKDGDDLHLYVQEGVVPVDSVEVKLRHYRAEHNGNLILHHGAWGPTIRIQPNSRLSVNLHNQLPVGEDSTYYGSLSSNDAPLFNSCYVEDGKPSQQCDILDKLITKLTILSNGRINHSNFREATLTWYPKPGNTSGSPKEGDHWIIQGVKACECPPWAPGSCRKEDLFYKIYLRKNISKGRLAFQVYEMSNGHVDDHNEPHGTNYTNLHAHGFHVSPNQDDIFRKVPASFSSYYTYDLKDHISGTMWYHPHVHGATAVQVASGMSGALIIEEPDSILNKYPKLKEASDPSHEKVMVFNQIFYDKDLMELPDFHTMERYGGFGKGGPAMGTTINGNAKPIITIKKGEVQRWRMVYSAYRTSLGMYFTDDVKVKEIAVDGIMFPEPVDIKSAHMAPGNRMDVLVQLPSTSPLADSTLIPIYSSKYKINCEYFPNDPDCYQERPKGAPKVIAYLRVLGKEDNQMKFPTKLPAPQNLMAVKDTSKAGKFTREAQFNIKFQDPLKKTRFWVNGTEFDPDVVDHKPLLGSVERWEVSSKRSSHPYHIHVNPFLVTEFAGRYLIRSMWKDVVMVSSKSFKGKPGSATMYTKYENFWGDFVLHCHILAHEDEGMMERVRIVRKKSETDNTNQ